MYVGQNVHQTFQTLTRNKYNSVKKLIYVLTDAETAMCMTCAQLHAHVTDNQHIL